MSLPETNKTERFQILLQQAKVPTDLIVQYFNQGHIEKLILDRERNKWIFHLHFKQALPVNMYQLLVTHIEKAFAHIARTELHIRFLTVEDTPALFTQYWPLFLEQHRTQLNGLYKKLNEKPPHCEENKVTVFLDHEFEIDLFSHKMEPKLIQFFGHLMSWSPRFNYQLESSEESIQKFRETQAQEELVKIEELQQAIEEKTQETIKADTEVLLGYKIKDEPTHIHEIIEEEKKITIQGYVFEVDLKELKSGRSLLQFNITDYTDSFTVKMFSRDKEDIPIMNMIKKGMWLKVRGSVQLDSFTRELSMMASDVNQLVVADKMDESASKRVELHLHTNMSTMDAVSSASDLISQAAKWGHPAIAITDHAVVQSFPEAYAAGKKNGIKILYGVEANLVDDASPITYDPEHRQLSEETYIVFDVETTGLSAVYNTIIELAAVKLHKGEVVDRFERFSNPHEPISALITELTGITDDMVRNAPDVSQVLMDFYHFIGNHTLVAHNASFDMGFLNMGYKKMDMTITNPVLDTLELARFLYPELKNHRLNTLCKRFDIELVSHHRAVYDAEATGYLLWKMLQDTAEKGVYYLDELNEQRGENDYQKARPSHCIILAKTQKGLKNLYRLVSYAHTQYFYRVPRIPRSVLNAHREGLIIGSGCDRGEVFEGMMQKSPEEVEELAAYYDYLEIHPPSLYQHLIEKELIKDQARLEEIIHNIVQLGKKLEKPVVATGNVHYLKKTDAIHRKIIIHTLGGASPLNPEQLPPVHLRTTDEMLDELSFLGSDLAHEAVIENSQKISEMMDELKPIPDELYTPRIEGADDEIRQMSYDKARSIYGYPLPEIVEKRIEKELNSIIGHGFAVIYLISSKLVKKSLSDGYLVGSRGSVGSSLVATFTDITEVNPLPPHYVCPSCYKNEFIEDGSYGSGYDLPDKACSACGILMKKDGQDIPFETFLGFKGDKVPDIDLNFSGEYQPIAHKYTQDLFGKENVYRAGTIGTVADKTAYGFVKKYEEASNALYRSAEIQRLSMGCTGVKRTTGQHPGGIIVVPDYMDIFDFCPIQYPADDQSSEWRTTHFDFHSIHDNLLKLDILGHDDPTMIRMLQELSGIDPQEIPLDDPQTMKIFSSPETLGVTEEQIMCKTGTLGIPEMGTRFVRQMLEDTKPTTFAELLRISGLSHGTDVWLNNAQDLIRQGIARLSQVISTRDDIMVYLIQKGLDPSKAFKIMESVRKGKGVTPEDIEYMKEFDVPDWYIESCQKIKYMFPKAHAAAYVLMAVRIAYFKVHHPLYFYAAYFSVRADDFDVTLAVKGSAAVRKKIEEINQKGNDASAKEKSLLTVLEIVLEMIERSFRFQKVDLYRSLSSSFVIDGDSLIPPFNVLPGVGTSAAVNIVNAREAGEFLSKEDLQQRSKISKTVLEFLEEQGCLEGIPDTNQLSLF